LLSLFQGVLGALPDGAKRRLEATVSDTRYFNAQLATAANVFLNMLIHPIVCIGLALASPQESFFAWGIRWWLALGLTIAVVEAMWRMRESVFRGIPIGETPMRMAFYGPLLLPVASIIESMCGRRGAASGVGFDGFYGGQDHFDEKIERARRYGEVTSLDERDDAYRCARIPARGAADVARRATRPAARDARMISPFTGGTLSSTAISVTSRCERSPASRPRSRPTHDAHPLGALASPPPARQDFEVILPKVAS
jgi:hypothetical protein